MAWQVAPDNHVQVLVQVGVEGPQQLEIQCFFFRPGGLQVAGAQVSQFGGGAVWFLIGPVAGGVARAFARAYLIGGQTLSENER
jgi:hypothetical protein